MAKITIRNISGAKSSTEPQDKTAQTLLEEVQRKLVRQPVIGVLLDLNDWPIHSEPVLYAAVLASAMSGDQVRQQVFEISSSVFNRTPLAIQAIRADLAFADELRPAPGGLASTLLYSRGIHALLGHRVAHSLWTQGMTELAMALKTQFGRVFSSDIHPAAHFGDGVWLEHAMAFSVAAQAVIEDRVCIGQGVTLGALDDPDEDAPDRRRYPILRKGAIIGVSSVILGGVEVGEGAIVSPGSVVLEDVPAHMMAQGIPAKSAPIPVRGGV